MKRVECRYGQMNCTTTTARYGNEEHASSRHSELSTSIYDRHASSDKELTTSSRHHNISRPLQDSIHSPTLMDYTHRILLAHHSETKMTKVRNPSSQNSPDISDTSYLTEPIQKRHLKHGEEVISCGTFEQEITQFSSGQHLTIRASP